MLLDVDKIKLRFEKKIDRLIKELNVYILMNSCREKGEKIRRVEYRRECRGEPMVRGKESYNYKRNIKRTRKRSKRKKEGII